MVVGRRLLRPGRCAVPAPPPVGASGVEPHKGRWVNTLRLAHLLLPDGEAPHRNRYRDMVLQGEGEGLRGAAHWSAPFKPPDLGLYPATAPFWPEVWAFRPPTEAVRTATSGAPRGQAAGPASAALARCVRSACAPYPTPPPAPTPSGQRRGDASRGPPGQLRRDQPALGP